MSVRFVGRFGLFAAAVSMALIALGAGSINGLAHNGDQSGRDTPLVDSFAPTGDAVSPNSPVVISFTEPMAAPTVVLSMIPAVKGDLTWADDYTLSFQPVRLAHGVSYEVDVRGRSVTGAPVRGQRSWRFTTVAGPQLLIAPGPSSVRLPILMYHYIRTNPELRDRLGFALSVTPSDFAAQMGWLDANGYHTVTMRDLINYLGGVSGLPSKPIIVTFDDGYADFYTTALPVLRSHDFTAVSYVVSRFINQPGYMTAAQVLAAQDAGTEIGSHTVGHVDLTRQSADGLSYQVTDSKRALEALLGRPVISFCYPYGRFGRREAAAVAAAGYQDATTTMGGSWHSLSDRFTWTRLRVSGGEGLADFAASVQYF
jgi:peptidoglycan/xylan/chitin deacetylase (PgdA/CDA1 family)